MKIGKASGPSGVAIEMFKVVGISVWNLWQTYLMISCSRISYQRNGMLSSLVQIFKGKGNPLNPNSYRGIKLLEDTFKLFEKMLDRRLSEVVDIDKMQCVYARERDCWCCVCSEETYWKIPGQKFFVFVDLEKAFDRVPREVTHFDLRQKGVPEYLVDSVMSLQKDSNLSSQGTIKFIFCES